MRHRKFFLVFSASVSAAVIAWISPSGFTTSPKMSVPAFIDITEEDQVQLKSFQKFTKRLLVEEPLNKWFYKVS